MGRKKLKKVGREDRCSEIEDKLLSIICERICLSRATITQLRYLIRNVQIPTTKRQATTSAAAIKGVDESCDASISTRVDAEIRQHLVARSWLGLKSEVCCDESIKC